MPTIVVVGPDRVVRFADVHPDWLVRTEADAVLRDLLMVAFMTTVGLSARLQLIREGGLGVVVLLALATAGAVVHQKGTLNPTIPPSQPKIRLARCTNVASSLGGLTCQRSNRSQGDALG